MQKVQHRICLTKVQALFLNISKNEDRVCDQNNTVNAIRMK